MLVAARLQHIAETNVGQRRYLDMNRLRERLLTEPATRMTDQKSAAA